MVGVESGVCCWVVFLVDFGLSWQIQHSSVVFGTSGAFQWFPACSGASSVCCWLELTGNTPVWFSVSYSLSKIRIT